jgi:hypothetical protein
MDLFELGLTVVEWIGLAQLESSCELGTETSGSIKLLGNYRMAAQLVASRVVFSSTELVS